jgi:hypothetical protein
MRTTIEILDELMLRMQQHAVEEGRSLEEIIEDAIRLYLNDPPKKSTYRLRWTTEQGELMPDIDLDDRSSLFDIMDGIKK